MKYYKFKKWISSILCISRSRFKYDKFRNKYNKDMRIYHKEETKTPVVPTVEDKTTVEDYETNVKILVEDATKSFEEINVIPDLKPSKTEDKFKMLAKKEEKTGHQKSVYFSNKSYNYIEMKSKQYGLKFSSIVNMIIEEATEDE